MAPISDFVLLEWVVVEVAQEGILTFPISVSDNHNQVITVVVVGGSDRGRTTMTEVVVIKQCG